MTKDLKSIANFFYEVNKLKNTPRSGAFAAGIKYPDSVADHSCGTAFIAFVLAKMEGADPYKTTTIAALHEMPETRIMDVDAVGRKYISKSTEKVVLEDQLSSLPKEISDSLRFLLDYTTDNSKEMIVARDADFLELMLQMIIYKEAGFSNVQHWIDELPGRMITKSAKDLAKMLLETNSYDWTRSLKVLHRKS